MNINVLCDYKIHIVSSCSFISEEDSTVNDIQYETLNYTKDEIMNGHQLLKYIAEELNKSKLSEITFRENGFDISHFNPNNCETEDIFITIIEETID